MSWPGREVLMRSLVELQLGFPGVIYEGKLIYTVQGAWHKG